MSDDKSGRILYFVITAILAIGFAWIYYAQMWPECRRVHPGWYCAGAL